MEENGVDLLYIKRQRRDLKSKCNLNNTRQISGANFGNDVFDIGNKRKAYFLLSIITLHLRDDL